MSTPTPASRLWRAASGTYKSARTLAIAVVGASVVLVGIAMLVLPGPAFIVIPTGLAILGIEFAWARRWLETIKARTQQGLGRFRGTNAKTTATASVTSVAETVVHHTPKKSRT